MASWRGVGGAGGCRLWLVSKVLTTVGLGSRGGWMGVREEE